MGILSQNFKLLATTPRIETYYIPGDTASTDKNLFGVMPNIIEETGVCDANTVAAILAGRGDANNVTATLNCLLIGNYSNVYKYDATVDPLPSSQTTNAIGYLSYRILWKQKAFDVTAY